MKKKYTRLTNNPRLDRDIKLALHYFGYDSETQNEQSIEAAIKMALTCFLADRVEGYSIFTGEVDDRN